MRMRIEIGSSWRSMTAPRVSSRVPILESLLSVVALYAISLAAAGAWDPAANAALFSIYHMFSPWNYVVIFVTFLPLAYYVRLRGNLLPVIITHCLFNSVGIVVALTGRS